ncbi:MAG: D-TA family PLP-dependent enzyme [Rhizobiaceae bacterium]|nr:D-TA family PLP-dependent enzyme [Rhizobiaceae bacterium]
MPEKPKTIAEIETPAVLIDVDRAAANIAKAQAHANRVGVKLRPHIKTHKLPFWAKTQVEAGAAGITCQKIGEAEVMADAGMADIFLPYNILGEAKLARLLALHRRVTLSVTADSTETVAGLARTFTDAARRLSVLVECETGMSRCGVETPAEAVTVAKAIAAAPGLEFGGLMTYPAAGKADEAERRLRETRDALAAAGLVCRVMTSGGTPDMWRSQDATVVTEYRPGTYIYMDRSQIARGAATLGDCALTVLATVVSRPTASRAVLDAGSKAFSSDTLGLPDFGEIVGRPDIRVTKLSEEHGVLTVPEGVSVAIGERVRVIPNHACVVSNLFDEVYLVSGDRVVDVLPVAARGKVT